MKIIKYILPKLLRKNLGRMIALMCISSVGVGILTAMLNTYYGMQGTFTEYFEEYHYPEITFFSQELFYGDNIDRVQDLEEVEASRGRLCLEAEATHEEQFVSLRCYSISQQDLLRYHVLEELPEEQWGDYIPMEMEAFFVYLAGFQMGDIFEIYMGDKVWECILVKSVVSPESTVVYRDENSTYSTREFGYAYFEYEDLKKMSGLPLPLYNQALIYLEEGENPERVEEVLVEGEYFPKVLQSYTYKSSPHNTYIENHVEPLKGMSYLISIVFFLISIVIIYLLVYQMIMEQKERTGILMALGSSNTQIAGIYLAMVVVITIQAGIVGNLLGYGIMRIMGVLYQNAFYLPYVKLTYSIPLAITAVLLVGLVVLSAVLLAVLQIFKLDPVDAIRKQPTMSQGSTILGKLGFLGYANKVCFSCSLRNRRRLVLSFLSTILTVAMITFALQYSDASDYTIAQTFEERFLYDGQVLFDNNLTYEQGKELLEKGEHLLDSYELFQTDRQEIISEDSRLDTMIQSIHKDSEMVWLADESGKSLSLGNGILLPALYAQTLGVDTGDYVSVNGSYLQVDGVYEACLDFVPYVSEAVFESISDGSYTGAFVCLSKEVTPKQLHEELCTEDGFAYLTMKQAVAEGVASSNARLGAAIVIILVLSFFVGLIIIYNMALINFVERKRVFSTMMALGMQESEIAGASLWETILQFIISLALGIPLGIALGSVLLDAMSTDGVQFTSAFSLMSGLLVAGSVGGFMLMGQLFALRRLRRLDIVEELKTKE